MSIIDLIVIKIVSVNGSTEKPESIFEMGVIVMIVMDWMDNGCKKGFNLQSPIDQLRKANCINFDTRHAVYQSPKRLFYSYRG